MHLCVLIHGLNGSPSELEYIAENIKLKYPKLLVEIPPVNYNNTHDGVLNGANRIFDWIIDFQRFKKVEEISFICHSLGGIYARAVIGILNERGILNKIRPVNFITLATPHLGSRQHVHIPDSLHKFVVERLLGQTILDLTMTDNKNHRDCLMHSLISDYYLKPLEKFQNLVTYSNAKFDVTVAFETAAIRRRRWEMKHDDRIILDDDFEDSKCDSDDVIDKMHQALNTLPWKRFTVIPYRPFFAHTDIIVRNSYWDKSFGSHIVLHLCTHFQA